MTQFCALFLDIYALLAHQNDSVFLRANMLSFDCMDFAFFCIYIEKHITCSVFLLKNTQDH